jgi:hypothetical protein
MVATRETGKNSFCKEWSNDSAWLAFTNKKWQAKEKFEAYSQAQEIQEQVNNVCGVIKEKRKKPSDVLKSTLRVALNNILGKSS